MNNKFEKNNVTDQNKISKTAILDVPNLIRTNNYYNSMSFIKNYEDTLQKMFKSNNNSNLINNNVNIFLWEISDVVNNDLFPYALKLNLEEFSLPDLENVIISGPYVRNCLVNSNNINGSTNARKELYLYRYCDEKWNDLIPNIDEYVEKTNEYVLEIEDKKICLIKKKYKSPSHIILQHDYIKRIGYQNGCFYVSSMFLIEFQKHKSLIYSEFRDPILNIPYDPLDIYYLKNKDLSDPIKIINCVDYDELIKVNEKNLLKIYNSYTCIETCLLKYTKEDNPIVIEELYKIIVFLCGFKYKRPPYLFAILLNIDKLNASLFQLLLNIDCAYDKINKDIRKNTQLLNLKNISDANSHIINTLIKRDLPNELLDFLTYIKHPIDKTIVDKIISYRSKTTQLEFVTNSLLDDYLTYYLILMTENLELITHMKTDFNMDIAINFLSNILTNGLAKSFYFLFEKDNSIITYMFEHNRNLLHAIKPNGNYDEIIAKIILEKPELINMCDNNGDTPVIFHTKNTPVILNSFIKYNVDLTMCDNDGNICLHHLCKHDNAIILKKLLRKYPELINMPNALSETPAMICCKNKREDMFYIFKEFDCDMCAKDTYGNTVYHYICSNSLCLGMTIKQIPNSFGITPKDYCLLSPKYYNFE